MSKSNSKYIQAELVRLYAKSENATLPITPTTDYSKTKIHNYTGGWAEGLHYEFWIRGSRVEVALHTETEKSKNALYSQMRSWEHKSPQGYPHPLRYETRSAKYVGLSTAFDMSTDPKVIVEAMTRLILTTASTITQIMNNYGN